MKKVLSILLCAAAVFSLSTSAFAATPIPEKSPIVGITPRFTTIRTTTEAISMSGQKMKCSGTCRTFRDVDIEITITVTDNSTGRESSSSSNGSGVRYTYAPSFSVVKGHTYTVKFAYNAGGETTSTTKTYTVK